MPNSAIDSSLLPLEAFMEPVLSAAAMRAADAYTIQDFGVPGFTLMESAGRAAVRAAVAHFGPPAGRHVVILCGRGNNGGDGLVMARGFATLGARVSVLTLAGAEEMTGDAALNLRLVESLREHLPNRLSVTRLHRAEDLEVLPPPFLFVDALLGTGLTENLRSPLREVVRWLNERDAPVLAVDIPTGLHADHGRPLGAAVRADLTVTMGSWKTGLLINDGPVYGGTVEVAEIGIPDFVLMEHHRDASCALRTTDHLVRALLPRRKLTAHKYSVGMALAVAGSPGLTGAPVMASTAAARVGAGAVVCASHQEVQPVLAGKLTEIMTLALPGSAGGDLEASASLEALEPRLAQASALLVGCGLGRGAGTQQLVRRLCTSTDLPIVLDADGLNAFEGHTELIADHSRGQWILTPHQGEFKRLAGDVDFEDRVELVRKWAQTWNCVLVLKGMPSLVGSADGAVYVCGTGNPSLATAGTGDVLAGMMAGLLAQRLSPERAALCALHLGGAASDAYAARVSGRTMLATDILDELPALLASRFE